MRDGYGFNEGEMSFILIPTPTLCPFASTPVTTTASQPLFYILCCSSLPQVPTGLTFCCLHVNSSKRLLLPTWGRQQPHLLMAGRQLPTI